MAANKQKQQLDAVNAMIAELGIDVDTAAAVPQFNGPRPGVSSGPGAAMSSGPGRAGMSSGPGLSKGPGANGTSRGPGAAASRGPGIVPATHTPDGRPLVFTGPPCTVCGEMIIGQVVNAMDKQYHPEHFVCKHCGEPFPNRNYVEHEGHPYCEADFNELFAAKCAFCMKPVTDTCIKAIGRVYHPEHFYCEGCGIELRDKPFKEHEGEAYCLQCKAARTIRVQPSSGVCGFCKKDIFGEYIILHGQRMHPDHYRCTECDCEFKGGNCHEYEGLFYCYECYLKMLKNICGGCKKPVVGRSITALGKVWHPEHFICFTCKDPFGGHTYYEHEGHAYCEPHYVLEFGKACHKCNKPIATDACIALGKHYHREHFVCSGCEKSLEGKEIHDFESKPMCKPCWKKLPKEIRKRIKKKKLGEVKAQKDRESAARKEYGYRA